MKRVYYLTLFSVILISCNNETIIRQIYDYEEYFALTGKTRGNYLVLLTNPECSPCQDVFKYIAKERPFDNVVIYNVDTSLPDNKWWHELLYSSSTPTVIYFSKNNEIIDIFQGSDPVVMEDIKETVKTSRRIGYPLRHFSSRMRSSSNKLNFYNSLFHIYRLISKNEDVSDMINESIYQYKYPFNLYLASLNKQHSGQMDSVIYFAEEAIMDISPYKLLLFQQTREKLKKIIDPKYDPRDQGMMKLSSHQLKFPDTIIGESQTIIFEIINIGNYPIKIYEIISSCDCLDIDWDPNPINGGETTFVIVKQTPKSQGFFNYELSIVSDSAEPCTVITIESRVIKDFQ